jgi:protein-L-isoaspartate(D-aspartate) O-methyltransferase
MKLHKFSKQILEAFEKVPRENFVLEQIKHLAYEDRALPIGKGQTISQPYTIAKMLELLELKKEQRVLEIGSGCGYVLALLSEIVGKNGEVFGVEIIKELVENSRKNLQNYENIKIYNKNGADGLNEKFPYTRILISAGCEKIPGKILQQLKEDGILVVPIGPRYEQTLTKIQRKKNKFIIKKKIPGFIFVKFIES